jgi:hypothetical protein
MENFLVGLTIGIIFPRYMTNFLFFAPLGCSDGKSPILRTTPNLNNYAVFPSYNQGKTG